MWAFLSVLFHLFDLLIPIRHPICPSSLVRLLFFLIFVVVGSKIILGGDAQTENIIQPPHKVKNTGLL